MPISSKTICTPFLHVTLINKDEDRREVCIFNERLPEVSFYISWLLREGRKGKGNGKRKVGHKARSQSRSTVMVKYIK